MNKYAHLQATHPSRRLGGQRVLRCVFLAGRWDFVFCSHVHVAHLHAFTTNLMAGRAKAAMDCLLGERERKREL